MLDFTVLNNDAPKSPTSPANEPVHIKVPADLQSAPTAVAGSRYKEEQENNSERCLLTLGQLLNERLGWSEIAISDYNKAVRDDKPPEEVALLAARALSLAVSEELIYTSLEKKYRKKYGITISKDPPFKILYEK